MAVQKSFMRSQFLAVHILLFASLLILFNAKSAEVLLPQTKTVARIFPARGVVEEVKSDEATVVINHEAISNLMAAMTMPFKVKDINVLTGLQRGDEIAFQLYVTETDSWVGQIKRIGTISLPSPESAHDEPAIPANALPENPLLAYKFTNELGQATSFNDFHGQALAITFFYTRCPLPNYCPRLSKNFEMAEQKLETMTNAPSNWHFISVSFDTEFDTPETLKNYGEMYQYDPKHWSFFTGPSDKIGELARAAGVQYEPDGLTINHNFRTLIIDAAGRLQMLFMTSGDLSDQIVNQIIKAAAVTNLPAQHQQ